MPGDRWPASTFPVSPGSATLSPLQRALNATLPGDVAVTGAEIAPDTFHARFSAKRRAYRYLIWNAPDPLPLLSRYSLHMRNKLDWEAMEQAAGQLVGRTTWRPSPEAGWACRTSETAEAVSLARSERCTWPVSYLWTPQPMSGIGTGRRCKEWVRGTDSARNVGPGPGRQCFLAADGAHHSGHAAGSRAGQTYCRKHSELIESRDRGSRPNSQTARTLPYVG